MYAIDNATAVPALPARGAVGPNPNGYFTDGNPGAGLPATIVDADWANMLQDELKNAILGAGIALDKTNDAQLLAAIQALAHTGTDFFINGPAGTFRALYFETAGKACWDLTADNTAQTGGNVGSNLQISRFDDTGAFIDTPLQIDRNTGLIRIRNGAVLQGAITGTTAAAGDDSTLIATTAFVQGALGNLSGKTVYFGGATLPASGAATSSTSVTFPFAFPASLDFLSVLPGGNVNSVSGGNPALRYASPSTSGFSITGDSERGGSIVFDQTVPLMWMAAGH